jgi:hypothetical protein
VTAQHAKVTALSGMKGPDYRRELDALVELYKQQAAAKDGPPVDPTNADAVEAYDFERNFPLQGVDPETQEKLTWDHPARHVLQRLADQHGMRDLTDQAYALATADGAKPTPTPAEWEADLRRMWGSAFAERYEAMHVALDRIEDVDKAAAARVDDAARRSPRIASVLADIGAKVAQAAE